MKNLLKQEKLQSTFPKLTEVNQHYVLGLAMGLKLAQNGKVGNVKSKSGLGLFSKDGR